MVCVLLVLAAEQGLCLTSWRSLTSSPGKGQLPSQASLTLPTLPTLLFYLDQSLISRTSLNQITSPFSPPHEQNLCLRDAELQLTALASADRRHPPTAGSATRSLTLRVHLELPSRAPIVYSPRTN